ncbi:MAG TPA: ester cyclase, partial [Rhodothermales bacterium]|nr:ester cyclase [Rhodothermales bacterium]
MPQGSSGHNKEIVGRFLDEVFNQGYVQSVDQFVSPDVVDHSAVIFTRPEGPGGLEEGIRTFLHAFPDFRVEVEQMIAEGDFVAARLQMSGTNTGDYR